MKINGQGVGKAPTGTSIRVGPSRRAKARRSATRSICGLRARSPEELRAALRRAFGRRDGPTLIDVPVGTFPSPWPFIFMPPVRGR